MRIDNNANIGKREKRDWYERFIISKTWIKCARSYKASVNGLCERCLARGLITPAEEVHHKVKLTPQNINRPEVSLNWANLIALCKDCHMKEHRKQKRWTVDEDGNVTPRTAP